MRVNTEPKAAAMPASESRGDPVLPLVGQEEVDGDDEEGGARQDELGEEEGSSRRS